MTKLTRSVQGMCKIRFLPNIDDAGNTGVSTRSSADADNRIDAFSGQSMSGSELLGKPVSEVLEWLFPLFDDLTQLLCKRDDVATVF